MMQASLPYRTPEVGVASTYGFHFGHRVDVVRELDGTYTALVYDDTEPDPWLVTYGSGTRYSAFLAAKADMI